MLKFAIDIEFMISICVHASFTDTSPILRYLQIIRLTEQSYIRIRFCVHFMNEVTVGAAHSRMLSGEDSIPCRTGQKLMPVLSFGGHVRAHSAIHLHDQVHCTV